MNLSYINLYKHVNIYGMTSILNSETEQNLFFKIYHIDFAKIATYKAKQFCESPGIVVKNDDRADQTAVEIFSFIDDSRVH